MRGRFSIALLHQSVHRISASAAGPEFVDSEVRLAFLSLPLVRLASHLSSSELARFRFCEDPRTLHNRYPQIHCYPWPCIPLCLPLLLLPSFFLPHLSHFLPRTGPSAMGILHPHINSLGFLLCPSFASAQPALSIRPPLHVFRCRHPRTASDRSRNQAYVAPYLIINKPQCQQRHIGISIRPAVHLATAANGLRILLRRSCAHSAFHPSFLLTRFRKALNAFSLKSYHRRSPSSQNL